MNELLIKQFEKETEFTFQNGVYEKSGHLCSEMEYWRNYALWLESYIQKIKEGRLSDEEIELKQLRNWHKNCTCGANFNDPSKEIKI